MTNDEQYEFKSVQAVRGTEGRSIGKWQEQGWELYDENPGKLRTTLHFRRKKRKVPWLLIAVAAVVAPIAIGVVVLASALGGNDDREAAPAEGAGETTAPSATPLTSTPTREEPKVLTARNSPQFAEVLRSDYCSPQIARFAEAHTGEKVEFDGSVIDVINLGGGASDVTIGAGDDGSNTTDGPVFKFRRVKASDLKYTGGATETLRPKDLLHLTSSISRYDRDACLLYIKPDLTEVR